MIYLHFLIINNLYSIINKKEYYNQRRRWIPSTMANLIDFLKDYKHILRVNQRVTLLFVFYILINFIASLLGPSTVILMLADTLYASFGIMKKKLYFLLLKTYNYYFRFEYLVSLYHCRFTGCSICCVLF